MVELLSKRHFLNYRFPVHSGLIGHLELQREYHFSIPFRSVREEPGNSNLEYYRIMLIGRSHRTKIGEGKKGGSKKLA